MEAKIYNHSQWVEQTDPVKLRHDFKRLLDEVEFEIIDFVEHYFKPEGYTCLWLLGESHFAIHTFPEHGRSYIELSSCHQGKHDQFIEALGNY